MRCQRTVLVANAGLMPSSDSAPGHPALTLSGLGQSGSNHSYRQFL
jgi:hypothetical protein